MIPHQLQIKNFLSYGPETQTIDFSNYHLICLSGKNGHGKSAMLDAITWAIWGQARKSSGNSKPDAGLLHLGQKHMMVILEFEVNGQHYRVRREFLNTASKPFATLDFGVKNSDGKLSALTDKTIKDTQEKIERTIGITYESFTNSTFLRQGQSNEFSKKSPKERKEILAQILQLSQFEHQKKIALMHAKKLHQDWLVQCNIEQRIDQELLQLANLHEQQAIVVHNIKIITDQQHQLDLEKKDLAKVLQELLNRQNEKTFLLHQTNDVEKNIAATQKEIDTIQALLKQQPESTLTALKTEEQQLAQIAAKLADAQQKKMLLKETYFSTREKLNEQTNAITQQFQQELQALTLQLTQQQEAFNHGAKQQQAEVITLQNLEKEQVAAQSAIAKLQQILQPLHSINTQFEHAQEIFEKNKIEYQNLSAKITYTKQQILQLTHQLNHSQGNLKDSCSQCQQPLTPALQSQILQTIAQQKNQTEQELVQMQQQIQNAKTSLTAEHANLQKMRLDYDQFIQLTAQEHEQTKQQEKLQVQLTAQAHCLQNHTKQQKLLEQNCFLLQENIKITQQKFEEALQDQTLQTLKQTLATIETEAKQISYNPEEHQRLQQRLTEVRDQIAKASIQDHQATKETHQSQLAQLYKNMTTMQEQLKILHQKLLNFISLEKEHEEHLKKELTIAKHQQELQNLYQQNLVEKGALDTKQKKQIELTTERDALQVTIKTLHQEMTDYQEIAKALGKDGIQALLIEQAIPEIEHETNQILARLTNNQTQIFIESLRDLKKGGSKETLDIKISDSFGLRDYEMFSGGEAFRIDFALRIGISKLLARRAGTTLQTIFIDEGFGSQDEEGLQLIMDNLYKIQDDFAKIIIVSHLPEMKEQFPVQFIVEKKRCGSTVSIVHQG
jgi:DNA repair protein SbcC/Rad50